MERAGFHGYRKNSIPGNNNNNNGPPAATTEEGSGSEQCTVREQDRFMPIANVIRIMRKILPAHAKISDDAKETIQECVSEYISFITGEANERCQREQRKTITAEDVLWAMTKLGFDDYVEPLTLFLHRYRDAEGERTGAINASAAVLTNSSGPSSGGGGGKRGQPAPPLDYGPFAAYYAANSGVNGGFFRGFGAPPPTQPGSSASGAQLGGLNNNNAVGDQHHFGQFK